MTTFHQTWGPIATVICGVTGLWGVVISRRPEVPRVFWGAVILSVVAMLTQVVIGVAAMTMEDLVPGDQHVFYGVLVAVTFAFAYIYRAQLRKRPALSYGLLLLFTMGLGVRGIMTVGVNF